MPISSLYFVSAIIEGVQIDSLIIGPEGSAYENKSTVEDQEH